MNQLINAQIKRARSQQGPFVEAFRHNHNERCDVCPPAPELEGREQVMDGSSCARSVRSLSPNTTSGSRGSQDASGDFKCQPGRFSATHERRFSSLSLELSLCVVESSSAARTSAASQCDAANDDGPPCYISRAFL
jgi:hypothetical protein